MVFGARVCGTLMFHYRSEVWILELGGYPLTYHPLAIVTSVPLRTLQHVVVKLKNAAIFFDDV